MRTVHYELLRPAEIVAERDRCPVVYVPIGPSGMAFAAHAPGHRRAERRRSGRARWPSGWAA